MPIQNEEVADQLERYADLMEIEGANPYRARAYRNAAYAVRSSPREMAELVEAGDDLAELHGIGPVIARKIEELVRTHHLRALERLEEKEGPELADLVHIPGLGPRRVRALHDLLGVSTLAELHDAAREGRIAKLRGFGEKTQAAILAALEEREAEDGRKA